MRRNCISKAVRTFTDNRRTPRLTSFYRISNQKTLIPKYLVNALIYCAYEALRKSRRLLEEKEIRLQVEQVTASFRCYDNTEVIVTLFITNLSNKAVVVIFQILLNGDVIIAQNWEVQTLKGPIRATLICVGVQVNIDNLMFLFKFGRTEHIMNNLNPDFVTTFVIHYFFEEMQKLRFEV